MGNNFRVATDVAIELSDGSCGTVGEVAWVDLDSDEDILAPESSLKKPHNCFGFLYKQFSYRY